MWCINLLRAINQRSVRVCSTSGVITKFTNQILQPLLLKRTVTVIPSRKKSKTKKLLSTKETGISIIIIIKAYTRYFLKWRMSYLLVVTTCTQTGGGLACNKQASCCLMPEINSHKHLVITFAWSITRLPHAQSSFSARHLRHHSSRGVKLSKDYNQDDWHERQDKQLQ